MFRTYYIPLIVIFLTILIAVVITYPRYLAFLDSYTEMRENDLALQESEIYLEELKDMRTFLNANRSDVTKLQSAIPSSPDLPAVMNYVTNVAGANGFSLRAIEEFISAPARIREAPMLQEHRVSLVLTGSYGGQDGQGENFKNFLHEIERSARFIQVESLSIQEDRQLVVTGNGVIIRMTLVFYSYSSSAELSQRVQESSQ